MASTDVVLGTYNVGFVIVGLFVMVWACALAYWRLAKVESRWRSRS